MWQIVLSLLFIYIIMTYMSLSDGVAPNCVMLCEHRIKNGLSVKYQKKLL